MLETGTGLSASPTAADLESLASTAPPDIRDTIKGLQDRVTDFDELLAEEPPDLEAIFNARFDSAARGQQVALERFAEDSCGLIIDRTARSRWSEYKTANHDDEPWSELVTTEFDVFAGSDTVAVATMVFDRPPPTQSLIGDACQAMVGFLEVDSVEPATVRVLVGSVVAVEHDVPGDPCRYP